MAETECPALKVNLVCLEDLVELVKEVRRVARVQEDFQVELELLVRRERMA